MTDSDEPKRERKRFFKDELESSQDNIAPKTDELDNSNSFLFNSDIKITEGDQNVTFTEEDLKTEFIAQIKGLIPDIQQETCNDLYEKFHTFEKPISSAVDYYFDHFNSPVKVNVNVNDVIDLSDDPTEHESSSKLQDTIMNSDPPQPTNPHHTMTLQSIFTQTKSNRREDRDYGERSNKKLKSSVKWKRFLGSIPVTAMATRPTIRPLKYGSELKLNNSISKNISPSKIYRSNGKKRPSMANFVRITDIQLGREIGRLPEDVAQILFPLLDDPGVYFEVTLVYCGNKRLSVGDSFILQLDCYLTSAMFETKLMSSQQNDSTQKNKLWEGSTKAIVETDEEIQNKFKRTGLISLFNKLRIKEVKDESQALESINNKDDDIIDIDDEQSFERIMSEDSPNGEDDVNHDETMNLNQLQNFYSIAQSSEVLKNLPETEPSKDIMKLDLRKYQKQGLTWLLRREREYSKAVQSQENSEQDSSMMNPLWKQFIWPKDMSWSAQKLSQETIFKGKDIFFYANLHTGEFSLQKPVLTTMMKGGILSDEMGLGKTISILSLILTVPYDTSTVGKQLIEDDEIERFERFSQFSKRPYASKTTLIVVPMSLLNQWHSEFDKSCNSKSMRAEVYYGGNVSNLKMLLTKTKNPPTVLITTYGIVQNEWTKIQKHIGSTIDLDSTTGLFSIDFYRIVIDEGHVIRNRHTSTSKAVLELSGKCKWVLTGTPIINRLDDIYSLVKFLRLEPWSQIGFWKQFVSNPFESKNFKQAFDVVNSILEPVFLRRTKQMKGIDGKPLVELPPKEIIIERLKFNKSQDAVYKQLLDRAEDSVKQGLARGDLLKKYSTILVNILRLRQVCCDIRLIGSLDENDEDLSKSNMLLNDVTEISSMIQHGESTRKQNGFEKDELNKIIEDIKDKHDLTKPGLCLECSICTTEPIELNNVLFTECGHSFCKGCLVEYIDYQNSKLLELKCPLCRHEIADNRLLALEREKEGVFDVVHIDNNPRCAKIVALTDQLQRLQDSSPGEQIVVFSQFSTYLDILEKELGEIFPTNSTKIYKFDGRLNLKDRSTVLANFQIKDPSKQKILLLSLKAGGVGLNLTCASYAFMMDPWWSPSMEDQAIDRIHRIGQSNNVKVVRFIIENSIEEKMLRIQERKRTIGEAMDADEDERRKRRIEEIKMLFE